MKALIDTCIIIDALQKREPFYSVSMNIILVIYYEDAVMVQTAVRILADCIVTRNLKDYRLTSLPVLSPEQFLEKTK